MTNEIKEIYITNINWTKTKDNIMGGVSANVVFKNCMTFEEYQKLMEGVYCILCNKDYITNLQEEIEDKAYEQLKTQCFVYKERINKAIEYINEMCLCSDGYANYGDDLSLEHIVDILQGEDK